MILQKLTDLRYVTVPHPPYSPGLSPTDYHFNPYKMLDHILPGWYCRNSLTWDMWLCPIHHILLVFHPLIAILTHIKCLTICCLDETAETHWLEIWDFVTSTIYSRSLTHRLLFLSSIGTLFFTLKIFRSKGEVETAFKNFLTWGPTFRV